MMDSDKLADLINDVRIMILCNFGAEPDSGEAVTMNVRPLFKRLSDAQAELEAME